MNYLTPKPMGLPMVPQKRSDIIALFGSGGFCFLWHVIASAPSAGELTNGYLHGGLIIDFIGQGKLRFLAPTRDSLSNFGACRGPNIEMAAGIYGFRHTIPTTSDAHSHRCETRPRC